MEKQNELQNEQESYTPVHERLKEFRKDPDYEGWKIQSQIESLDPDKFVIIKTSIFNKENELMANGHALEIKHRYHANEFAFVENCETISWGRALANLGIGIDRKISSLEEKHSKCLYFKAQRQVERERRQLPVGPITDEYLKERYPPIDKAVNKKENRRPRIKNIEITDKDGKETIFESVDKALAHYELYTCKMSSYLGIEKLERNGLKVKIL